MRERVWCAPRVCCKYTHTLRVLARSTCQTECVCRSGTKRQIVYRRNAPSVRASTTIHHMQRVYFGKWQKSATKQIDLLVKFYRNMHSISIFNLSMLVNNWNSHPQRSSVRAEKHQCDAHTYTFVLEQIDFMISCCSQLIHLQPASQRAKTRWANGFYSPGTLPQSDRPPPSPALPVRQCANSIWRNCYRTN